MEIFNVNHEYKYEDDHISIILKLRLSEENLGEENNIFKIAPTAEAEDKLVHFLFEEKKYNYEIPQRTLLIPYLIGPHEDGHWVGVVVRFENSNALQYEYLDSNNQLISVKLKQDIIKVYGDKIKFTEKTNFIKHKDGYSCGPYMIENLVSAAKNYHHNLPQVHIIRGEHISLMETCARHKLFYKRQKMHLFQRAKSINHVLDEKFGDQPDEIVSVSKIRGRYKFYPRCEYKTRFEETSAFRMTEPDYWGTYFRSTAKGGNSDRLSRGTEPKDYHNSDTNTLKSTSSKAGTMYSPWESEEYREIFYKNDKWSDSTYNPAKLYDLLLAYKIEICHDVIKQISTNKEMEIIQEISSVSIKLKKIEVYFSNDYPCVMVTIAKFNEITTEKSSLYNIAVAYFVAIANRQAQLHFVPIELVIRASFGHNIPSVAETGTSFRINIGIVPKVYAAILAKSLIEFDDTFLVPLLSSELQLNFSKKDISNHNRDVNNYNDHKNKTTVCHWIEKECLYTVLKKVGDSSGRKVSAQIMRMNKYVDLLANYVTEEVDKPEPNFAIPLNRILTKLTFVVEGKKVIVKLIVPDDNDEYGIKSPKKQFPSQENENIKEDSSFWGIIKYIALVLEVRCNRELSETAKTHQLAGLYKKLEIANLEFVRNSSYVSSEDGYGSDSGCEVESSETETYFSKKITVITGMRTVNLAQILSVYRLGQSNLSAKLDMTLTYYETPFAIKFVKDISKTLNLTLNVRGYATIRHVDLSHCAASHPLSLPVNLQTISDDSSESDVIIFDYTSTKTENIKKAVDLLIKKVKVIILINSGLKNEQVGADMNPYGTVRIVARDSATLNELIFVSKELLNEEIQPKELHNVRKAYKDIEPVVTNESIHKRCSKNFKRYNGHCNITSITRYEVVEMLRYLNNENNREKITLLFSQNLHAVVKTFYENKYLDKLHISSIENLCKFADFGSFRNEINDLSFDDLLKIFELKIDYNDQNNVLFILIGVYKFKISDVIYWKENRIHFYASINVVELLRCYEKDEELAKSIVGCNHIYLLAKHIKFSNIFDDLHVKKERMGESFNFDKELRETLEN